MISEGGANGNEVDMSGSCEIGSTSAKTNTLDWKYYAVFWPTISRRDTSKLVYLKEPTSPFEYLMDKWYLPLDTTIR
jgi:hypothetical protein